MPPILALLLCTIFVFFLLRLDRKQSPEVSRALWIPTIWMLSIASKPLAIWFGVYGSTPDEGSPLDRAFLSSLLCLALFLLAGKKLDWSRTIKENSWLILLIAYMLVSIVWSEIPFVSLKRWIREIIAVVMAFLVLTERDPREAVLSVIRRTVYILVPFSLLLIKYYPEYGIEFGRWSGTRMWVGVTTQKNCLGELCVISAFFLIWSLVRRLHRRDIPVVKYQTHAEVFILIITLLLLKGAPGAYSATAIMSLAVGLAVFIGLLLMKRGKINLESKPFVAMLAAFIIIGIVTFFYSGSTIGAFAETLGRDPTLTGRTGVWESLIPAAMQRPILGSGIGGFWISKTRILYQITEGHSGYLDMILALGFIGMLLVSMFLLSSCRKAQKIMRYDFDWSCLWICSLVMTVCHNITESSLDTFTSLLMSILLFLSVSSMVVTSNARRVSPEVRPLHIHKI